MCSNIDLKISCIILAIMLYCPNSFVSPHAIYIPWVTRDYFTPFPCNVSLALAVCGYRIYSINRPGRLLNFWTLRVGAYSRWALIRGWALIRINTVVTLLPIILAPSWWRWGGGVGRSGHSKNKMSDSPAFYGYMCGTNFLRVLIFAIFPAIRKNKFPEITIFPAKIYSKVNIKFARQKYSTKKSRLFNYHLSLSFRNITVYNELTGFT